jgi:hypothetical protein
VIAYRYSTIIYWTKLPWVSHFFWKKRFSPFERRFPYLLLWNFSDSTGWKILCGAWNAWHKNSGYRGVCFLSVYLFSVVIWSVWIKFVLLCLFQLKHYWRNLSYLVIHHILDMPKTWGVCMYAWVIYRHLHSTQLIVDRSVLYMEISIHHRVLCPSASIKTNYRTWTLHKLRSTGSIETLI